MSSPKTTAALRPNVRLTAELVSNGRTLRGEFVLLPQAQASVVADYAGQGEFMRGMFVMLGG